jgi:lysozyme
MIMSRPILRLGSTGSDVSAWQQVVSVAADGVFGPKTQQATKDWQTAHGLTADGIVGPATWAAAGLTGGMPAPHDGWTLGVDTSFSQGVVDWPAAMAQGVGFAFIKATDGLSAVDSQWSTNSAGAGEAQLPFGSYHVLEPGSDPTAQATHYASVAKGVGALPPVLDFEVAKGLKAVDALARAVAFLDAVESAWGNGCSGFVYAGPSFISQLATLAGPSGQSSLAALATRRLWVAHYGVLTPSVPAPWTEWTAWQFAGDGGYQLSNGVVVDVDWLKGGPASLIADDGG